MSDYEQLAGRELEALRQAVAGSTIAEVALRLGYSRPSVSMALAGKYIGGTSRMRARIIEVFLEGVLCPFLNRDIRSAECKSQRETPLPSGPRAAINHWRACQHCIFNPVNYAKPNRESAHVE